MSYIFGIARIFQAQTNLVNDAISIMLDYVDDDSYSLLGNMITFRNENLDRIGKIRREYNDFTEHREDIEINKIHASRVMEDVYKITNKYLVCDPQYRQSKSKYKSICERLVCSAHPKWLCLWLLAPGPYYNDRYNLISDIIINYICDDFRVNMIDILNSGPFTANLQGLLSQLEQGYNTHNTGSLIIHYLNTIERAEGGSGFTPIQPFIFGSKKHNICYHLSAILYKISAQFKIYNRSCFLCKKGVPQNIELSYTLTSDLICECGVPQCLFKLREIKLQRAVKLMENIRTITIDLIHNFYNLLD